MAYANRSWTNDKEHDGCYLAIGLNDIRFDMYSLPVTKYSGGISHHYKFEELREGSDLYKRIISHFSEAVAKEALKVVLGMGKNPDFKNHQGSLEEIDNWLAKFKENDSIKKLWDQSEKIDFFSADEVDRLSHFGIKKGALQGHNVPFIDVETEKQFTFDHNRSQIIATEKNRVWKAFLFNNRELIILHEVLGELLVSRPFEEIKEAMTKVDAEIWSMRRSNDLILVDFSKNRIRSEFGYYLFVINPDSGKIRYQKMN